MIKIPLYLLLLSLASCGVSKEITLAHINTDSITSHVRDSMTQIQEQIITRYEKTLHEVNETGIEFEQTKCPDYDSLYKMLDSAGKYRMDIIMRDEKISNLTNRLKINADGSIEASGAIKSYKATADRYSSELAAMETKFDSLVRVKDTATAQLKRAIDEKSKTKDHWYIPWWIWIILAGLGALVLWKRSTNPTSVLRKV